jgi:SAM-dependent methyltransferase
MKCRHCSQNLDSLFLDLGYSAPSNAYLSEADLSKPELTFPLRIFTCTECKLVQTEDFADADALFSDNYAYFSSVSSTWLSHAKSYCSSITKRLGLNKNSFVIELASNDGYLLKNFVAENIPCLGIEPTDSTADAAEAIGVPVLRKFFGFDLSQTLKQDNKMADLVIGNNVYAHVPDINDFTKGIKNILKSNGTVTLEFPHLLQLLKHNQFDTVYHEHFSYLSLYTVSRIFEAQGLRIFDVQHLPTHGGSLRVYGCHQGDDRQTEQVVDSTLQEEEVFGLRSKEVYEAFQDKANTIKNALCKFLIEQKEAGKTVAGYGAAAKGNTLLNYAGIRPDLLNYICDAAPSKQGNYTPSSHIPIYAPEHIKEQKPDYVLILPWNIAEEVMSQLSFIRDWGGQFVTAVPEMRVS